MLLISQGSSCSHKDVFVWASSSPSHRYIRYRTAPMVHVSYIQAFHACCNGDRLILCMYEHVVTAPLVFPYQQTRLPNLLRQDQVDESMPIGFRVGYFSSFLHRDHLRELGCSA